MSLMNITYDMIHCNLPITHMIQSLQLGYIGTNMVLMMSSLVCIGMNGFYSLSVFCIGIDFITNYNRRVPIITQLNLYRQKFMVVMVHDSCYVTLYLSYLLGSFYIICCVKYCWYMYLVTPFCLLSGGCFEIGTISYTNIIAEKFNRIYRPYVFGEPKPSCGGYVTWEIDNQGTIVYFPMPSASNDM